MKKINLLFTFSFFLISFYLSSQSCLPEGITFSTQEEIDNFQTNYPNCTEIEGYVAIGQPPGSDITNLNSLNVLNSIGGFLWIEDNYNLPDLTGLNTLSSINGALVILDNSLTSLSGLGSLTSVGGSLYIIGNDLTNLIGLNPLTSIGDSLYIWNNPLLINLTGLDNVTNFSGDLIIGANDALENLSGLDNLTTVGGNFDLGGNNSLTSLSNLGNLTSIGGYFFCYSNNALSSLSGLDNLLSVSGELEISYNDALNSLSGLDNIVAASIDDLNIQNNSSLSECDIESICNYLVSPTGDVDIHDNAIGCNSVSEVEEACGIVSQSCLHEGVVFSTQQQIDNFQTDYPGCIDIAGNTTIEGTDINNLNGFDVLTSFGENLSIYGIEDLTNLSGLDNVATIGGSLSIAESNSLTSLTGLNSLTTIGGWLSFDGNDNLTNLSGLDALNHIELFLNTWDSEALVSLTGLENVNYIGGLSIHHTGLADFTELENLTSVGEHNINIEDNNSLTSLSGLDNIEHNSIYDLTIAYNSSLSACDIESICDYLAAPGGTITIYDNATGCNTADEIEEACGNQSIGENSSEYSFSINPNPCSGSVNLRYMIFDRGYVILDVFETSGVKVMPLLNEMKKAGTYELDVDLSDLPKGIYFCRLQTYERTITKKMIKL